jgi:hypothetical protein
MVMRFTKIRIGVQNVRTADLTWRELRVYCTCSYPETLQFVLHSTDCVSLYHLVGSVLLQIINIMCFPPFKALFWRCSLNLRYRNVIFFIRLHPQMIIFHNSFSSFNTSYKYLLVIPDVILFQIFTLRRCPSLKPYSVGW